MVAIIMQTRLKELLSDARPSEHFCYHTRYFDWFYEKCNIFANNYVKYDRWWVEQFTRRWFHRSTLQENLPLLELHEKLFFRMNQKNVENIQRAFTLRRDIRSDVSYSSICDFYES